MKVGLKIGLAAVVFSAVAALVFWFAAPIRSTITVAMPSEAPLPEDAVIDRLVVHKSKTHHVGVLARQVAENLSHFVGQATGRA